MRTSPGSPLMPLERPAKGAAVRPVCPTLIKMAPSQASGVDVLEAMWLARLASAMRPDERCSSGRTVASSTAVTSLRAYVHAH